MSRRIGGKIDVVVKKQWTVIKRIKGERIWFFTTFAVRMGKGTWKKWRGTREMAKELARNIDGEMIKLRE